MIVVLACGSRKDTRPLPALQLYTGLYFRGALRWARSVVPDTSIYVVSSKYGLVPGGKVIAPYEMRVGDAGAATAAQIAGQAKRLGVAGTGEVILVGGQAYRELLAAAFPSIPTPFHRFGRMGYQLHAFKTHIGRLPAPQ